MSYLFHDEAHLRTIAEAAVERGRRAGAQVSAAIRVGGGARIVRREGEVDTATRDGYQSLSVNVFRDGRTGSASTASIDEMALERVVDEALTIAGLVQPDPDAGLADTDWLALETAALSLYSPDDRGPSGLSRDAAAIEEAAAGNGVRVTEAGAASNDAILALATSAGFSRTAIWSNQARWCSVLAKDGEAWVQDHADCYARRLDEMDEPQAIAGKAVAKVLARRGARKAASSRGPVLFTPLVGVSLLSDLVGALSGGPQYTGATFLPNPLGGEIAANHVSLVEDPFEPFGLSSAAFDSEGVGGTRRPIIENGLARGLFLSSRSARRLKLRSTGNADGPYNLRLTSRHPPIAGDALLDRLGTGLVVSRFLGGRTDPVSGTWTRAAMGFWVEGGHIAYPVQDITLAGELPEMFRNILAIGSDVERHGAFRTGSLLIDDIQVGGAQ